MPTETKMCPDCAEQVLAPARKCRFCGHEFGSDVTEPGPDGSLSTVMSPDVPDLLSILVERSLVAFDEATGRYRLLETVRQYARDRMFEEGDTSEWRERHLAYFLGFSEQAVAGLKGAGQAVSLDRLDEEADNLRAALEWAAAGPGRPLARLAGGLSWYWYVRSHNAEGRLWIEEAVRNDSDLPDDERAMLHYRAAILAHAECDFSAARGYYHASFEMFKGLGKILNTAWCLGGLASIALEEGDVDEAHRFADCALERFREANAPDGIAAGARILAEIALLRGDYDESRERFHESLALHLKIGDDFGAARVHHGLADLAHTEGDNIGARYHYREALTGAVRFGQKSLAAASLDSLATMDADEGHVRRASILLGAASALRDHVGVTILPVNRAAYDSAVAAARSRLGDASFEEAWAVGRSMTLEQAAALGLE